MTKVSVIIPVYNTEEYLSECLDSIINQTLDDIEIICIDDGSTDNSLEILKKYKNADSRINIIVQENHGLSYSRNVGLSIANGEYIYFMDSDDILEIEAFEELYELSQKNELDMVLFKLINFNDKTKQLYTSDYYEMDFLKEIVHENVFNYNDITENIVDISVSAPGKFFKRNLISNMKFPEGLIFEDNPFFIEAMFKADKVIFYDKHLYKRRIRSESLTTSHNSKFSDILKISNIIIDLAKKYDHYDELKDAILNKKINSTFNRFYSVDEFYKKEFFEMIKEDFTLIKKEVESSNLNHKNRYIFDKGLKYKDYKEFEIKVKYYVKGYQKKVHAWEYIRIDAKNHGEKNNSIQVIEKSDKYLEVRGAHWLINETGEGFLIESYNGELDLKLKMINDGKLNLEFKGVDIRDENNNKIKVSVDYTSLIINGESYLKGHNILSHDNPFTFQKNVKNAEIIDIHIKWMTYDKMSSYVDEINVKDKKYEELLNSRNSKLKKIKSVIKRELTS